MKIGSIEKLKQSISLSLILALSAGTASAQTVRVEVGNGTKLGSQIGDMLIEEAVLPAGSVIELSIENYKRPANLPSWTGKNWETNEVVKNIRVVKAPGLSDQELAQINSWNHDDGLFISKRQLAKAAVIDSTIDAQPADDSPNAIVAARATSRVRTLRTKDKLAVYRNDGVKTQTGAGSDADSEEQGAQPAQSAQPAQPKELDHSEAKAVVDRVLQVNRTARETGKQNPFCVSCQQNQFYSKFVKAGIPEHALQKAFAMMARNPGNRIHNKRFMAIADFTQPSNQKRLFVLDLQTGQVESMFAAHGKGSDLGHVGIPRKFGNSLNSHQTPAGFHVTSESIVNSGHVGRSLVMNGLEARNSLSARRGIVIHSNAYASDAYLRSRGKLGRSFGCTVVDAKRLPRLLNQLKGGALVYNYTAQDAS